MKMMKIFEVLRTHTIGGLLVGRWEGGGTAAASSASGIFEMLSIQIKGV